MPRLSLAQFLPGTLSLVAASTLFACGELPDEHRIEGSRILAIRQAVSETWLGIDESGLPARAQAIPFETVEVAPFLATPTGPADVSKYLPIWLACELRPGEGLTACIKREREKFPTLAQIPACPTPQLTQLNPEQIAGESGLCRLPDGPVSRFTVPLTFNLLAGGSFELSMIAADPGTQTTSAACFDLYLAGEYKLPNECIYAVQRLPIGPEEAVRNLVTAAQTEDSQGVLAAIDLIRESADRHPRVTSFKVAIASSADQVTSAVEVAQDEVLDVKVGDLLTLQVESPAGDLQSYLVPGNLGSEGEIRSEFYEGMWFRTFGDLLSGESEDPVSLNRWEIVAQDDDEPAVDGQLAYLYYVVRDTRAGTSWHTLTIRIRTEM